MPRESRSEWTALRGGDRERRRPHLQGGSDEAEMLVLDLAFLSEGMKILIADDHSVVRRGLEQIIATRPGWRIAAEVSNSDDILPALRRELVDLAILDVSFGDGRSGIDILGHIRAEFPTLRCLMLSMHTEGQYAIRCL